MIYRRFKAKNSRGNQLSAVDILGRFDFGTTLISLDSLDAKDLSHLAKKNPEDEQLTDEALCDLRKVLPLAIHEYTHFVDATSTVWGIDHLAKMRLAYECDYRRGGNETSFFRAKEFSDHLNRIKYPNYYTVVNEVDDWQPWLANISIGKLFGSDGKLTDESILFIRFSNHKGQLIARSPISPVSILEASAVAQEIHSEAAILSMHGEDFQVIESVDFSKRILSFLYNKELTEYSACVHMLANQQQCTEVGQAFRLVSLVTRIVLNSTKEVFDKVLATNEIATIVDLPQDSRLLEGIKNGLKHRNVGILYFLIVSALPENSYKSKESAEAGVNTATSRLGLDLEFITTSASEHIKRAEKHISNSDIRSIVKIASAAKNNFQTIHLSSVEIPFDRLGIPKVMLGDLSEKFIFPTENNELSNFDIEECFNELSSGESWTKRFSEGCL